MSYALRSSASRMLLAVVPALLVACADPPAAPSRTSEPPPTRTPAPTPLTRITGKVLDGNGQPVGGARLELGAVVATVTDHDGAYAVDLGGSNTTVAVEKDGYEDSWYYLEWAGPGTPDVIERNLRIHAIARISAGETIDLAIQADDGPCAEVDVLDPCRRVRIASSAVGRLAFEVDPPVLTYFDGQLWDTVAITPGNEVVAQLVLWNVAPPQRIKLRTSFTPQ